MAKVYAIIGVICLIQFASSRVVREAPAPTQTSGGLPTLSELAKKAEEAITGFHGKFLEAVGVRSNEELVQVVQERGKTYADQLQSLLGQLGQEAQVQAGKADETFTQLRTNIGQTIEDLRAKNPELTANVQNLESKFEESLRSVLHNTEDLTTRLRAEGQTLLPNVENIFKQIVDNTREAATKVFQDLQSPTEQKE